MKIMYRILTIFIILSAWSSFAQTNRKYETNPDRKRANIWYFGQNAGISFNTNPPTALTDGKINTQEGCSSISDTGGNLLFYTDGLAVWDRNHQVMTNGTGLMGDKSSTQSAIIIHHPQNDSLYFIVTTPYAYDYNVGARYNIVNIKQNKVIAKNVVLHPNSSEKITAVNHINGKDIWIVGHEYGTNTFFSVLLTKDGFICPVLSNIGTPISRDEANNQGEIKSSYDGKKIAICHYDYMVEDIVELFDFNNSDGKLLNPITISSVKFASSLAFSDNLKYLYICEGDRNFIQYNIENSNKTIIKLIPTNQFWGGCQKTPNNKLMFHVANFQYVNSLNNYNDSNFSIDSAYIVLSPKKTQYSLPNFNQSYFYTPSIDFVYSYHCYLNKIEFEGRDTFYADSFNWRIKKVYGNYQQSASIKNPTVTFPDTGLFEIRFISTKGSRSDTVSKQISILPKITKGFLGKDTTYKSGSPFSLLLKAPAESNCILWQDNSSGGTLQVDTAGIYYVKITNKAFCTVSDTIIVTECNNGLLSPSILRNGDTLYTKYQLADSFIWYRNGQYYMTTIDSFLKLNDTGTYRVEVFKSGYCSKGSLDIEVHKLGFDEYMLSAGIRIYPNPANTNLNIELEDGQAYEVTIVDACGKTVFESTIYSKKNELDISHLTQGLYILKLTNQQTQNHYIVTKQ